MWNQVYNPLANELLSTLVAAIPVVVLLALIASGKVKAHVAAIVALGAAIVIAIWGFTMPTGLALRASVLGLVTGFFPIGWIVLNVLFLYRPAWRTAVSSCSSARWAASRLTGAFSFC